MPDHNDANDLPVSNTPLFAANEKIAKINVADEIKNSFLDYSMSVIISRALPDVRDGLKPSQRRILYAMHELSLYPGRKPYKCAKICGEREDREDQCRGRNQKFVPRLFHVGDHLPRAAGCA